MQGVSIQRVADSLGLKNFTQCVDLEARFIELPDINRPALQMAGFFEHFEQERVQIIGTVEYTYLNHMPEEKRHEHYRQFLSYNIPCVVFCRDFQPEEEFLKLASANGIPVLGTSDATSSFTAELIYKLTKELAPCISIHGVLVDIYGEGVLIMGESGIGKSEAALELIRRGHVKEKQNIDLVIKLEDWKKGKDYDRLGLEEEYTEILGNKIVCHSIPIRPGRNLAVICEAAAANHRQKKMGYNAAQELYRRVQENISGGSKGAKM